VLATRELSILEGLGKTGHRPLRDPIVKPGEAVDMGAGKVRTGQ